jgi:predicted acetylornithine/succinylornithine family transaminase
MTNREVVALAHGALMDVYACAPIALERGEGAYLYDVEGKHYLDFFCGLAVTSLGHAHPGVTRAIVEQAEKLTHVSNVFHTEASARLAAELSRRFGDGRVFLCNSGAEANEAAIKLARRWGASRGSRYEIVTALNSFHGRTLATLAATGQEKYHVGFQPLPQGFRMVPFDDLAAVRAALRDHTVAVMIEPIQGEGGVVLPRDERYLDGLRELCDKRGLLLIFDEVQTGVGRTGKFFAYEHWGVRPDVATLAKALANGLPIGAAVATPQAAAAMTTGAHGSTFGGNPVSCASALAVLSALDSDGVLENCAAIGGYLAERLRAIAKRIDKVVEVRGKGMLIGIELRHEARSTAQACLEQGLIVNATAGNVLRLLPPLNLTRAQADEGLAIIRRALGAA